MAANPARTAERRSPEPSEPQYTLRLFVTGATMASLRAITNLKGFCEEHLKGRYELEVVDIYQQPALAKEEHVLATPTLVKKLPLPLWRLVGDLNDSRLLTGLDLRPGA
ncbi:MAG TPA: circadian clock KaiB family protein [Thermoanaerobaculia bacterium]|nr:circadian clock KaiB family protein [Thermoanaerobaculia bacterium]